MTSVSSLTGLRPLTGHNVLPDQSKPERRFYSELRTRPLPQVLLLFQKFPGSESNDPILKSIRFLSQRSDSEGIWTQMVLICPWF